MSSLADSDLDGLLELLNLGGSLGASFDNESAEKASLASALEQKTASIDALDSQLKQARADLQAVAGLDEKVAMSRALDEQIAKTQVELERARAELSAAMAATDFEDSSLSAAQLREEIALHTRTKTELQAAKSASAGREAQLASERAARYAIEDQLAELRGPFDPPAYDMEIVARDGEDRARELRLVPSVSGKLATAIEQRLLPAPLPYSVKILEIDRNGRPLKVKLMPARLH